MPKSERRGRKLVPDGGVRPRLVRGHLVGHGQAAGVQGEGAEKRLEVLVVDNVLHLGHHDAPGVLVDQLGGESGSELSYLGKEFFLKGIV